MLIGYKNSKLRKICTEKREAKNFLPGDISPDKLVRQLNVLAAFANLDQIPFRTPPLDFHPLRENYAGMFSVKLNKKWRIIFKPAGDFRENHDRTPVLDTVTSIEIQKIEDYHKGK